MIKQRLKKMSKEEILNELRVIKKILTLGHSDRITKELEKLCTTDERKKIWVLINGESMTKDIAKEVKLKRRGIERFLNQAEELGFIKNPKMNPPYRLINFVPPEWIELFVP